jgi:hypothetical protein
VVADQFLRPVAEQAARERVGEDLWLVVHDEVRGPRRRGGQRRGARLPRSGLSVFR